MASVVLPEKLHYDLKVTAAQSGKKLADLSTELLQIGYNLKLSASIASEIESIANKEHITADQAITLLIATYNSKNKGS